MSLQAGAASQDLHESFPVTTLTVLILSLIPCVVVLLVLNCLFLVYKLRHISMNKRFKHSRQDSEEMLLQSCVSTRCSRDPRITQAPNFFPPHRGRLRVDPSVASEPSCLPQPVTSSRTSSSKERAAAAAGDHQQQQQHHHQHHHQGMRFLRPDGATRTGPCSTILANSAESAGRTSRVDLRGNVEILNRNEVEWKCVSSAPLVLRRCSDSDADTRSGHAPPNSPAVDSQGQLSKLTKSLDFIGRSRSLESLQANVMDEDNGLPLGLLDKLELECEHLLHHNTAMMTSSCLNTFLVGPGLDSDFGASAGISLRIVSADSDGLTSGVAAVVGGLEWDYYDPCYVQQNNVPAHKHSSRPAIHSKQYWV